MGKYRIPTASSEFYIPKQDYLTAIHWCLRYPLWKAELELEQDSGKAIEYDKDHVQTSNDFDPVSTLAIRRAELSRKVELLESTIRMVDNSIYSYLLMGVGYGFTEAQLRDRGMPCGHNYYYKKRQQILYEIAKKI
mgnify:CR=1 FL=1